MLSNRIEEEYKKTLPDEQLFLERNLRARDYIREWSKHPMIGYAFTEQAGLTIAQQRNLAIILHNTSQYIQKLASEAINLNDDLDLSSLCEEAYLKYIELISAEINVIGLETIRDSLYKEDFSVHYQLKPTPISFEMSELIHIMKNKNKLQEGLIPYIGIHCFAILNLHTRIQALQEKPKFCTYGDIAWLPYTVRS